MSSILKINKYIFDQKEKLQFDNDNDDWSSEILNELQANISKLDTINNNNDDQKSSIIINIELVRKTDQNFKDHLVMDGTIQCNYYTPCIRCLVPTVEKLSINFSACFLHQSFENLEEYKGLVEVFCQGKERDLYFYNKGSLNLQEFIHEQLFLQVNQRPLHTKDCKGLCPTCGFNLNFGKCAHVRKKA